MKLFLATLSFVALIVVVNSMTLLTKEPSAGLLAILGLVSLTTLRIIRRNKCKLQTRF
jgi:hypothetical protein